jgi:hypothetical protein
MLAYFSNRLVASGLGAWKPRGVNHLACRFQRMGPLFVRISRPTATLTIADDDSAFAADAPPLFPQTARGRSNRRDPGIWFRGIKGVRAESGSQAAEISRQGHIGDEGSWRISPLTSARMPQRWSPFRIEVDAIREALEKGVSDFWAMPSHAAFSRWSIRCAGWSWRMRLHIRTLCSCAFH